MVGLKIVGVEMKMRIEWNKMKRPLHNYVWYNWKWNGHSISFLYVVQQNKVIVDIKKSITIILLLQKIINCLYKNIKKMYNGHKL